MCSHSKRFSCYGMAKQKSNVPTRNNGTDSKLCPTRLAFLLRSIRIDSSQQPECRLQDSHELNRHRRPHDIARRRRRNRDAADSRKHPETLLPPQRSSLTSNMAAEGPEIVWVSRLILMSSQPSWLKYRAELRRHAYWRKQSGSTHERGDGGARERCNPTTRGCDRGCGTESLLRRDWPEWPPRHPGRQWCGRLSGCGHTPEH
jgi:hypothetical protein